MVNEENAVMNFTMLKLAIITVGRAKGEIVDVDEAAKFYIDYIGSLQKRQRVDYLDNLIKRFKENEASDILGRTAQIEELMAIDAIKLNVARIKHYPISISKKGELYVYEDEVVKVQRKKRPAPRKQPIIDIDPNEVTIIGEEELKKSAEAKGQTKKDAAASNGTKKNSSSAAGTDRKLFHKRHHSRPRGKSQSAGNINRQPGSKPKPSQRQNGEKPASKRPDNVAEKSRPQTEKVEIKKSQQIEDVVERDV